MCSKPILDYDAYLAKKKELEDQFFVLDAVSDYPNAGNMKSMHCLALTAVFRRGDEVEKVPVSWGALLGTDDFQKFYVRRHEAGDIMKARLLGKPTETLEESRVVASW